ncbi:MAG: polysaccharide deacetylase family protein [Filifactoraceae bacterium]
MKKNNLSKIKLNKTQKIRLLSSLLIVSLLFNLGFFVLGGNKEKSENPKSPISTDDSLKTTESKDAVSLGYQSLYPDLYASDLTFKFNSPKQRSVYLTFDDGPSKITPQLLDTLKAAGVKATFFVLYTDSEEGKALYKRIVDEGHSIGVHSTSHNYSNIYQSVEAFLADFEMTHRQIKEVTGVDTRLFRFPGGSINSYNMSNYQEIIAEMTRRGFIYYDWSVDSKDTSKNPNSDLVVASVVNGISGKYESNVLMHDAGAKTFNVDALPKIIKIIQDSSYDLLPLDSTVKPHHFNYPT